MSSKDTKRELKKSVWLGFGYALGAVVFTPVVAYAVSFIRNKAGV